jgi:hypothetical protein
LKVLYEAARLIYLGERHLLNVMDYAYQVVEFHEIRMVRYDSFREWMIQLQIGTPEPCGRVRPGPLCLWWVENMRSGHPLGSSYAACLAQRAELSLKRSRWHVSGR